MSLEEFFFVKRYFNTFRKSINKPIIRGMQNKGITIHSDDVCRPLTQERRDAQEEGVAVQLFGRAQY
jgi:hypothetical protein